MIPLHWTAGLHHDGSALYVSNPSPKAGETVMVTLRAPHHAPIRTVFLRNTPDGEHHLEAMQQVGHDVLCTWWEAKLRITMPVNNYRFKVMTDEGVYWLNALGTSRADSPDWYDFKLLADFTAPSWLGDTVFYQIFPDRFCNGDPSNDVTPGEWERRGYKTQLREWGAPPLSYREGGTVDFYGGDLQGIHQKLDYLHDLGVNALYLNPIFVAYTNHRYDVVDYDHVDSHLGGDEALIALRRATQALGMRLILDAVPNHCGSQHRWFKEAQTDSNAPTAEFFTFYKHPNDYESWLGHRSLVKLNYTSEKLRDAMYRAPESVLRRWLREPYCVDGWRLDVANMTARQGMNQLQHKVMRGIRRAVKGQNPQAYLYGENFFDGTTMLQGDELDGVMNYQGFTLPIWGWLPGREPQHVSHWLDSVPLPAEALAEQWARFRASIPWATAMQQFNQLDSHDTPRILSILHGDKALLKLGFTLLMTFPGVPCVYYGDEIGMEGGGDPDNRRCMRWVESTWDTDLRDHCKRLIQLRKTAPALKHGGFQQVYASGGLLAYQRQSKEQRLIVVGYRGPEMLDTVDIPVWHAGMPDGAHLVDLLTGASFNVMDGALHISDLPRGSTLILEAH